jgi:hypothetical protein
LVETRKARETREMKHIDMAELNVATRKISSLSRWRLRDTKVVYGRKKYCVGDYSGLTKILAEALSTFTRGRPAYLKVVGKILL